MKISRGLLVAIAVAATTATTTEAQSLFNAAGLGVPVEALDGRARALGNLGIGLDGASFMPTDPASLGRLAVSTGVMAAQPSWVDYESDAGPSGRVQGNRFPLLGIAYPLIDGMMFVQVGAYLDQHYRTAATGVIDFGEGPLEATDDFEQDGSISNINLGYARMLGERVSVGLTVGRYAGSVVRTFSRTFGDDETTNVDEYVERGEWSYTGHSLTAGVAVDLGERVRTSVSVQIPTRLDASASEETNGADQGYDLPVQYRAGATLELQPGLLVVGSAQLVDWSVADDDLGGSGLADDANGFGLGVELSRARLWGRDAPLRFGFRRTGIPFGFDPDDRGSERAFAAGLGLELSSSGDIVLAGVDIAIERGLRSGGGLTENFWRATLSLLASGL